jgi:hypothetical protein
LGFFKSLGMPFTLEIEYIIIWLYAWNSSGFNYYHALTDMAPMMIDPLWLINTASSLMGEYSLLTTKEYFCENVSIPRGSYARQVLF